MSDQRFRISPGAATRLAAAVAMSFICWSCATPVTPTGHDQPIVEERPMMGTTTQIQVIGAPADQARRALDAAFAAIKQVEDLAHPDRPTSDVFRLNEAAGKQPVSVHPIIFAMLQTSQQVSEQSRGAFDATFAGVGRLWKINDPANFAVPTEAEIAAALPQVGYQHLKLDAAAQTAFLEKEGIRIGLGAIAKGWAADLAVDALRREGVANAIVSPGGNMRVTGRKLDQPWRIGIQHPRRPHGESLAVLAVEGDRAVVTSGDYERFVMHNGVRYGHILDPRTGRPADRCQSVTIVGPNAGVADALATAVFVLGAVDGLAMLAEHYADYDALVVDPSGGLVYSPRWRERVKVASHE
jgi:thiamine biosynthesis lipoprotein